MTLRQAAVLFSISLGVTLLAQSPKKPEPILAGDRVNAELPSWLHFGGEERTRLEYIAGSGFKDVGDLYLLNRLRLDMRVRPLPWLTFNFEGQDSRVFGQNALPASASQKDSMDLRVGYAQIGLDDGIATLRAGRQGLNFSDGRFIADPNWSNVGRTFDAARLTLHKGPFKVDLFSGVAVKVNQTEFDQSTPGEHVHGAWGLISNVVPHGIIEPYFVWRLEHNYKSETGKAGNLDERTVGVRFSGTLPWNLDYVSDIASQSGSFSTDTVKAWTGHWVLGGTLPDTRHKPRLFIEYARASGDENSKDGRHGTFDPLFPSGHDKFGLTDLFGSSNIVHIRPGVQYTARPGMTFSLAYNDLRLANSLDSLYLGGKAFARSTDGSAGTHVGREVDISGLFAVTRSSLLNIGYGRLFPGEFLQKTNNGVPYNLVFCNFAQRF